ncbi:hypothetical protein N7456_009419 [Penicillium angulare]|uniref:Uncharacterized protein n=1 Tax=Penicillium angulare TaxID=116970 RepID=A0A9W9F4K3_9EURO|nr:hypothetical protein N7456_009419 [Penicillium angulare]
MFGKEDGKLESLKEKVRAILPTNDSDSKSKDYETDSIRTLYMSIDHFQEISVLAVVAGERDIPGKEDLHGRS